MNKHSPSHSFTADAVRAHEDGASSSQHSGKLNPTAMQIARQYRRDTMSPVMVSGILRLVELVLLMGAVSRSAFGIWAPMAASTGTTCSPSARDPRSP
jgi:hypothetical protein